MSELTRIKAFNRAGLKPNKVSTTPEFKPVKITQLRINDAYQRQMGDRSVTLCRMIANDWDWSKYHAPVIAPTGDLDEITGLPTYEVLDGQHTATAAVMNGSLLELPCLIVEAGTVELKAEAFVGLNKNRVQMTTVQVFWASVAAKKEYALDIIDACRDSGATIIKRPPPYGDFLPGEVSAIVALEKIAKRGGRTYVSKILKVGVACRLAPIGQFWIKALDDLLLCKNTSMRLDGGKYSFDHVVQEIVYVVNKIGSEELEEQARTMSKGPDSMSRGQALAYLLRREVENERERREVSISSG